MPEYLSSSNGTGGESIELPFVSFEDIAAATDNFSDLKQIGKGGFGKVYKVTKSFISIFSIAHIHFARIIIECENELLLSFHNSR
jgi:hypothetical protein